MERLLLAAAVVALAAAVAVVVERRRPAPPTQSSWSVPAQLDRGDFDDAVPTIVVADEQGVVRASFVGPPSATDLWAAVAKARDPDEDGTTP